MCSLAISYRVHCEANPRSARRPVLLQQSRSQAKRFAIYLHCSLALAGSHQCAASVHVRAQAYVLPYVADWRRTKYPYI